MCVYIYIYIHTYTYVHMYICTYVHMCIYVCMYVYVCIYIYIYYVGVVAFLVACVRPVGRGPLHMYVFVYVSFAHLTHG